jgi:hypothetical protein
LVKALEVALAWVGSGVPFHRRAEYDWNDNEAHYDNAGE